MKTRATFPRVNATRLGMATIILGLSQGCAVDDDLSVQDEENLADELTAATWGDTSNAPSEDEIREGLAEMGIADVKFEGDWAVIDGDGWAHRSSFVYESETDDDTDLSAQRFVNVGTVGTGTYSYFFHDNISAVWQDAIVRVYDYWSSNLGGIRFVRTTDQNAARTRIGLAKDGCVPGALACANFPDSNAPGKIIHLRTASIQPFSDNAAMAKHVMAHEIGHTLGFAHTDSNDGSQIDGTPTSDPRSVMRGVADGQWHGFTDSDKKAINTKYPR